MFHLNRRKMLIGLAASSTAAASKLQSQPAKSLEDARLIELSDALPKLHSTYIEARKSKAAIVKETKEIWPLAPEEIVTLSWGELETSITGAGIKRIIPGRCYNGEARHWQVITPNGWKARIRNHKQDIARIEKTKSKRGLVRSQTELAKARKALRLSKKYYADIERIRKASGYDQARESGEAALAALKANVDASMNIQAKTMVGVVIQAQALAAWGDVTPYRRAFDVEALGWPQKIATSIITQSENQIVA